MVDTLDARPVNGARDQRRLTMAELRDACRSRWQYLTTMRAFGLAFTDHDDGQLAGRALTDFRAFNMPKELHPYLTAGNSEDEPDRSPLERLRAVLDALRPMAYNAMLNTDSRTSARRERSLNYRALEVIDREFPEWWKRELSGSWVEAQHAQLRTVHKIPLRNDPAAFLQFLKRQRAERKQRV